MSYAMRCNSHSLHEENCSVCRRFDQAVKQELAKYNTPPEQHTFVTGPKTIAWMKGIFGC